MAIFESLKAAYAIGGSGAVFVGILLYTVIYLYRALQKEHHDRLRQAREDRKIMQKLLSSFIHTGRASRPDTELMDAGDAEEEENTGLTYLRRDTVHRQVRDVLMAMDKSKSRNRNR